MHVPFRGLAAQNLLRNRPISVESRWNLVNAHVLSRIDGGCELTSFYDVRVQLIRYWKRYKKRKIEKKKLKFN